MQHKLFQIMLQANTVQDELKQALRLACVKVVRQCCEKVLTHTVVTDGAVGGSWGPENLAGEAVL